MKKKKQAFGKKKKAAMGMRKGQGVPTAPSGPTNISNPIQLLNNYAPLSETSLVPQTETIYQIGSGGIISRHDALPVRSAFSLLVTAMMYAPGAGQNAKFSCSDVIPAQPDGTPEQTRDYLQLFHTEFGGGYHIVSFILNSVPPVSSRINVTIKHPPAKRRIVTAEMFVNIAEGDPLDRGVSNNGKENQSDISPGKTNTTRQDTELVYGIVGIGGPYIQFVPPVDYIAVDDIGTNIDDFDCSLKTFYKLSSAKDQFNFHANATGTKFRWGAAIFTLRSAEVMTVPNTKVKQ